MIRMRVSDKSVSDLNLVLCRDAKDLVDPPRAVHHRNFARLCRADEIDKVLHRTHFDLFEVEPAVHVTKLEVRLEVRSRWESGVRPLTSDFRSSASFCRQRLITHALAVVLADGQAQTCPARRDDRPHGIAHSAESTDHI